MLKRVSAALLFGGLLLGLTPTAAEAAPAGVAGFASQRTSAYYGSSDHRDDHYRCMYRCDGRDGYNRSAYDRNGYDRSRYDRSRYDRSRDCRRYGGCRDDRVYHGGDCWYHDGRGWHRCRSGSRDRYYGGGFYSRDYGGRDSAHASGGYDSHRQH